MRLFLCILILTFCLPFVSGQDLTEQEALQKFTLENPRARALQAKVELARATARTEGLRPNGNLSVSREMAADSPETYLLYEQPLPITGRRDYLRRAAFAEAESEAMSIQMQLHDLRVDARLAFLDLLLTQEQLDVYDSEKVRLQEMADILRKREKAGESSGYDVVRAERELSMLEADRGTAEARMENARGRLALFFVNSQNGKLRAIGTLKLPDITDAASLLKRSENRGDILSEMQLAESSRFSLEAARRKRYPEPIVTAGMKSPVLEDQRHFGYVLSVTVPLPLFDRGKEEFARAEMARRAAEVRAEAIKSEAHQGIKAAIEETRARIRAAELYSNRAVAETGDLVRIARAAYEEDEAGILELIDAYRTQREVRLRLQELVAAARQSALELERLVGEEVIP